MRKITGKVLWLSAIAIVVILGGLFLGMRVFAQSNRTNAVASTAQVTRGEIQQTVLSSGQLQPASDLQLTFANAGTIASVSVKAGDVVTKGQAIASLDPSDLQLAVTQAQANLDSAQAKLAQLKVGPTAADLASAQAQVQSAQAKLDQLKAGATPENIANARASLASAQAKLHSVKSGTNTPEDIAAARSTLQSAQAKLDQLKAGPTQSSLANAQAQVQSAQDKLAQLKAGPSPSDLVAAQTSLASAQAKLAQLKAPPTAASLSAAQLKVSQAQINLTETKSSTSLARQSAELAFNQADHALRNAQDKYNQVAGPLLDASGNLKDGLSQTQIINYNTALRALQDAEDNYSKAQLTLNDARQKETLEDQLAQQQLDDAQTQLTALTSGPTQADLSAAQASVDSAQANLDKLTAPPTQADLSAAQAAVVQAQSNLDTLKAPPAAADIASAEGAVSQAQSNLNKLLAGPTQDDITQAQAAVDQAQNNLNALLAPPTQADLTAAQATLSSAQSNLAKLQAPATPADIATAQAAVDQAQANLDSAKIGVGKATLVAPFSGVIAAVPVSVGQQVSANTAVAELVDNSSYHLNMNVGESDIQTVKVGQPVDVTFDALPDTVYTGTITFVAPQATISQGVVSYLATVTLDPKAASNSGLRPGLSATAAAIVNQNPNALLVPNRAVRTEGQQKVVYVIGPGGAQVRVTVQTGISNDTSTEIVGNTPLREGDSVVTNLPTTTSTGTGATRGGGLIGLPDSGGLGH